MFHFYVSTGDQTQSFNMNCYWLFSYMWQWEFDINVCQHRLLLVTLQSSRLVTLSAYLHYHLCIHLDFILVAQVVYSMVPRAPFSKCVLCMIKIMTDGRSVDVISGTFSWHFRVLECHFFPKLSFTWGPSWPFFLLRCCFWKYLINSHRKMRHSKGRSNMKSFGRRTSVSEPVLFSGKYFTCLRYYSNLHKN